MILDIVDQLNCPPLELKFSPCKNEKNGICGCGETGRRAGFRFLWETIWVRVPSSAPRLANENAVIARNPWKIQGFLHVEKRDIFLQKYNCKMTILGF